MKWHEGAFCSLRVHSDSLDETACSFLLYVHPHCLNRTHKREVSKKNTRMANDLKRESERGEERRQRRGRLVVCTINNCHTGNAIKGARERWAWCRRHTTSDYFWREDRNNKWKKAQGDEKLTGRRRDGETERGNKHRAQRKCIQRGW